MKRTEAESIGDILCGFLDTPDSRDQLNRQKVSYFWSRVVGPEVNRHTTRRYVEDRTLHVYIDSAAIKSEMAFAAHSLIKVLNNEVGASVIDKIIFH